MSYQNVFEVNKLISEITDILRSRIIDLEVANNIPSGYLKTALALHIPQFSEEDIFASGNVEFQVAYDEAKRLAILLKDKINSLPEEYKSILSHSDKLTKVKHTNSGIVEIDAKGLETEVEFKEVSPEIGNLLQEKLHYIGQPREDTLFHFGLFRKGDIYPFAYSAYSILDRKYLLDSLPFKATMDNVLVLTRSFSINSSPINSMSMLFGAGINKIKEIYPGKYKAVITAINPNTLFKGTVFKGSTFFTFATVPFLPTYYKGNYITRKSLDGIQYNPNELSGVQIECKPTIWMGNGLDKNISEKFKECKIINVTKESYLLG